MPKIKKSMKNLFIICSLLVFFAANAQVGVNTPDPRYDLEINGFFGSTPQTLTEGGDITSSVVDLQSDAPDQVYNLPSPTQNPGVVIFVRNSKEVSATIQAPSNIISATEVTGTTSFVMDGSNGSSTKSVFFVSNESIWIAFKPSN